MHEDDSPSPSGRKKNDARCVRGYTRPADPLPRRRDKTLGEERARRGTIAGIVENSAKWIVANSRIISSDYYASQAKTFYHGY